MNDATPKRLEKNQILKVEDASISDDRIPRNLILMYGDTPYIQKAGLEWKANQLFGGAGYSMKLDIIENDRTKYVLIKATLTILKNNVVFENYGEAHPGNVNSRMLGQLLHLAVTRAECRVLRMATATGYASYDEVMTMQSNEAKLPGEDTPAEIVRPATDAQKENIRNLIDYKNMNADDKDFNEEWISKLTFVEAAQKTRDIMQQTKKK